MKTAGQKAKETRAKTKRAIKANFTRKLDKIITEAQNLKKMLKKHKFY